MRQSEAYGRISWARARRSIRVRLSRAASPMTGAPIHDECAVAARVELVLGVTRMVF